MCFINTHTQQDEATDLSPVSQRVIEVLDRRLGDMKRQLTHTALWNVVEHVESRFGRDQGIVHPLVLEAEVETAMARHEASNGKETPAMDDSSEEKGADKVSMNETARLCTNGSMANQGDRSSGASRVAAPCSP